MSHGIRVALPTTAVVMLLAGGACVDAGAEHMLLDRFFAASRLRDRTALARISTVTFEPLEDGIVVNFVVIATNDVASDSGSAVDDTGAGERVVALSLADPTQSHAQPIDDPAILATREVMADADVRGRDGAVTRRRLLVTLRRAETVGTSRRRGRWIVTGFHESRQSMSSAIGP